MLVGALLFSSHVSLKQNVCKFILKVFLRGWEHSETWRKEISRFVETIALLKAFKSIALFVMGFFILFFQLVRNR